MIADHLIKFQAKFAVIWFTDVLWGNHILKEEASMTTVHNDTENKGFFHANWK